jgi:hypothetical protein
MGSAQGGVTGALLFLSWMIWEGLPNKITFEETLKEMGEQRILGQSVLGKRYSRCNEVGTSILDMI